MAVETTLPMTVPALLARNVDTAPDALAVVDRETRLTYADLRREVDGVARALIAHGVEPGDRIAILAPNSWHWVVAALAIKAAGAWLLPLNTRLTGPELEPILQKSGARIVFTVRGFLGHDYEAVLSSCDAPALESVIPLSEPDGGTSPAFLDFVAAGAEIPVGDVRARSEALGPEDIGYILFTSGTTGEPKGVLLSHGAVMRMMGAFSDRLGCVPGERILAVSPFSHLYGLFSGILMTLINVGTLYPLPVLKADDALTLIESEKITHVFGPPTVYQMLLGASSLPDRDLSSLRLAQCGAANIPPDLIRSLCKSLGFERVSTAYGLTEAAGTVSATSASDSLDVIATSTGALLPGVEVRIVDDELNEVPPGTPGEILVRAPGRLMSGYFGSDAPPSPIDDEGFLHTGDSGYRNPDGHLVITGRKKDMFTVGGFNVYPAEVEKVLYAHPGVAHAAVVAEPDPRLGEIPVAFVVPRPSVHLDPAELMEWCRQRVANYKAPRFVELVDELPMTASGKIQKAQLRRHSRLPA